MGRVPNQIEHLLREIVEAGQFEALMCGVQKQLQCGETLLAIDNRPYTKRADRRLLCCGTTTPRK